jgi:hypothetical protein
MTSQEARKEFRTALLGLLDKTGLLDRRGWSIVLGVSESAISQWVGGKTIPRPIHLKMVLATLKRSTNVPLEPLRDFEIMARKPATNVSPLGGRMLPTVAEYMSRPINSDLSRTLAKLSPERQEEHLRTELRQEVKVPTEAVVNAMDQKLTRISWHPGMASSVRVGTRKVTVGHPHDRLSGHETTEPSFIAPSFVPDDRATLTSESARLQWPYVLRHDSVLITGVAGIGKTRFLKQVVNVARVDARMREFLGWPVYLPAWRIASVWTPDELWTVASEGEPAAQPHNALLLLDDIDQIPSGVRGRATAVLRAFRLAYPESRIVMSSRPSKVVAMPESRRYRMHVARDANLLLWACNEVSTAAEYAGTWDDAVLRYATCLLERPDVFRAIQRPLLLSYSAHLYAAHSIAACHDTDVLQSCIELLLSRREHGATRRRARRWEQPQRLQQSLTALCYESLVQETTQFTMTEAEKWLPAEHRASSERLLATLAGTTGLIEWRPDDKWHIAPEVFQTFLAAVHVVEGGRGILEYLKALRPSARVGNMLGFACGLTDDAGPLLRFALEAAWKTRGTKAAAIANMLAQHLIADRTVIDDACREVVDWVDLVLAGWTVEGSGLEGDEWRLVAQMGTTTPLETDTAKDVRDVLHALHRSRHGPTRPMVKSALDHSSGAVTRALGPALETEGYLECALLPDEGATVLIARVRNL